ncbi:tRNA (guanosine(37)-N1)-methyltransferase TrmD [Bacillaceae bacterium SIJ1]|uniref:tRNA (guanosine(37)-N1)-methyltransferase TrmD n=1 Tax=Litoribacterium kuwaitense TaxID=1398745 RepID=UPI0013EAD485|nr:tRNA (guanosine(37)-N1)-methyltransferase TrmD [Litoribacterium kuwaitense]NGP44147.1 tRNA (guanosine(37)-N1)-methyltransferase TrmD [Litoribacterium kuwaitense]
MRIDVLTLFPEMFSGVLNTSMLKKAQDQERVSYHVTDFRTYADNKHQSVDDAPYGGGAGMLLTPQPLFDAVDAIKTSSSSQPHVVLLCPQGTTFSQAKAHELAEKDHLLFLCGHYEGYDERIREALVDEEISIGDYILTGGELGAMVVIDAVTRLLPGTLGNAVSAKTDSFSDGRLEHPHYTRPASFRGLDVPEVLLSGNHERIAEWRRRESFMRTLERRPDLLNTYPPTEEETQWLNEWRNDKKRP